jgi:AhpD family alkylhydroperoxidase
MVYSLLNASFQIICCPLSQNGASNRPKGCMNQNSTALARLDPWKAAPEVFKAALALENAVKGFGIAPKLLEIIKLRASQINGCAHCINIHFNDAVKAGESLQRLNLLPVWRETPHLYTDAERAVLRWTESLTKLPSNHVSDEDYLEISSHFDEAEVARITLAIATINAWNRFGTAFLPAIPAA